MQRTGQIISGLLVIILLSAVSVGFAQGEYGQADIAAKAAAYRKQRGPVRAQADGNLICEAEEFAPDNSPKGWQAKPWGQNYYAASFANCFLSRKAFLGAPEQCRTSTAKLEIQVDKAGRYLVLVRYEAAYRFQTQFKVQIEQRGKTIFDRMYGGLDNTKIWAFSQKLKKQVAWSWGASENIVWEGHDAFVELKPGKATLNLIVDKQPEPAAKRNIDLVMLTTDIEQVKNRIEKERYLPLDGMLTQSGDVWMKVTNLGDKPLTFQGKNAMGGGNWQQHSPYWVHLRNWPKIAVTVPAGKSSSWAQVGHTMDSLNDGQWFWTGNQKYRVEFGLKTGPNPGQIERIGQFEGLGDLILAADADTRYSRRLRRQEDVLFDLVKHLQAQPKIGRVPTRTLIYAHSFKPGSSEPYNKAVKQFRDMFGFVDASDSFTGQRAQGYIDVRGVATAKLEDYCKKLGPKARKVAVVSLGDEIGLPKPSGKTVNESFGTWLKSQGVVPADIDPKAGGDWSKIKYSLDTKKKESQPGVFYWSRRYLYHYGIGAIKTRTDILRKHLPNAHIGANFSPHYPTEHMFLGEVFKWVSVFRADGMTLPWSEDYIWQVPVCSPQTNHINLDLFRAGIRHQPDRPIMYYVMPHAPNNTPRMWRRLFYGALGHGAKMINLFEFRPVQSAYTENHVSDPAMYAMILRSFGELGRYEDILQTGRVRSAQTALWFSQTSDIWKDTQGSFAGAKRALYTSIIHQQVPLDFLIEADALDGTLKKYKVLYLADQHVSKAASKKIAAWVTAGGTLFATAGAGMFDELNHPNTILRRVLGVDQIALDAPRDKQIQFIKQDLPFVDPIDKVSANSFSADPMPVFAVRSRIKSRSASVMGTFADGSPAITVQGLGKGQAIYCAFLPSLSYYKPAIPRRPVDRGATDDAMCHFLPTQFDQGVAELIGMAVTRIERPVQCSQRLVEATVIDSPKGTLIHLINWSNKPIDQLKVTINFDIGNKSISLAGGGAVEIKKGSGKTTVTINLDAADALIFRPAK